VRWMPRGERPSELGWYWIEIDHEDDPFVIDIWFNRADEACLRFDPLEKERELSSPWFDSCRFAGPLSLPEGE